MALPRFLVDPLDEHGMIQLGQAEAHHGVKVLRLSVGDACVVFDGRGYQAHGKVDSIGKKSMGVTYNSREFEPRDHDGKLHFAIALPKGDRQRNVIEKLVELGVDRLTPIDTHRSVSKLDSDAIERLRRYGIEACKQSHRNRLMQIDPCCSWKNWIQQIQTQSDSRGWVLHPAKSLESIDAPSLSTTNIADQFGFLACDSSSSMNAPKEASLVGNSLVFAIGPEGGFTSQEILQAVDSGLKILDLGDRILRVETAVSVAAVLGSLKLFQSLSDGSTGSA